MNKLIIGFAGFAGAGKDTAAWAMDYVLRKRYTEEWLPKFVAFADPMRAMLGALGVPTMYMTDRTLKETPVPGLERSYRQLAQTLGTEWGRVCHGEDFWVKAAALRVDQCKERVVLITDVRFPNEAAWLKSRGGYLIRVNRPGVAPVNPHQSEAHVPNFKPDVELDNLGDLPALQWSAARTLDCIIREHTREP